MKTSSQPQSNFLKKCVLASLGIIAVLANIPQHTPQAPVVNSTPFDNAEFAKIMTEHARNADPVVLHYAEEMTSADPTTNFALYSQVCIASDHGTQKVKALPFLRSAIAQQFNLSESSSFVKDFASVINVTVIDLGCDRTAPLNQNSPAAVDFNP